MCGWDRGCDRGDGVDAALKDSWRTWTCNLDCSSIGATNTRCRAAAELNTHLELRILSVLWQIEFCFSVTKKIQAVVEVGTSSLGALSRGKHFELQLHPSFTQPRLVISTTISTLLITAHLGVNKGTYQSDTSTHI